jgi:DNA-binding response OmpR family regulator
VKTQKTILFLEDEPDLLSSVSRLLREAGYKVIDRRSAEEGFSELALGDPDLLLVDIRLPGVDGLEFFKKVKTMENLREKPFVFLTAFNNLKTAIETRKQGAAEYITKPFDFEYLITRIRDLAPPT